MTIFIQLFLWVLLFIKELYGNGINDDKFCSPIGNDYYIHEVINNNDQKRIIYTNNCPNHFK